MEDYRNGLGYTRRYGLKRASNYLYYPVHPGNAKQVMEPATLWFERRARRVQTCDKRQTLELGQAQRAATIQRFINNSLSTIVCALSGQAVPQGAFAVFGER